MLSFCCPLCKGPLSECETGYQCIRCRRGYPVVSGIADFRIYPDPYIDQMADREKAAKLAESGERCSFAELLGIYYSMTPEVPADLARYYTNHHLSGTARGAGIIERMLQYKIPKPSAGDTIIDLGCGTGGFLAALAERQRLVGTRLVGVDVAFRWLIVARKRLQELGLDNVQLVCACADYLPFFDGVASHVTAENLIEHVRDQIGLFREIKRVRAEQSSFLARTVNRFALGPEPHVGVWGVGYLPRLLMNGYVKLVKGIEYRHIYLQSAGELRDSLRMGGQFDARVQHPLLLANDFAHHTSLRQKLFKTYSYLTKKRMLKRIMTDIGPYLDVVASGPGSPRRLRDLSTPITSQPHRT